MKGIVLAGGAGTRLHPVTKAMSKQMLPLYNKPMIYYPVSIMMLAGIRDILIISTPTDLPNFKRLFGDGSDYGVNFSYAEQPKPEGLAQAFLIANECGFLSEGEECALILGDNVFHSAGFSESLHLAVNNTKSYEIERKNGLYKIKHFDGEKPLFEIGENGDYAVRHNSKATVFGYYVKDPERYGVAEIDKDGNCLSIEEKPQHPKSNICVTGLYFYPGDVVEKAKQVKPSARGELEITALNQMYLEENRLHVEVMQRGSAWFDTGTFDSLAEAANYVETIEKRQGLKIACLEEIAYNNNWIDENKVRELGNAMSKNEYGKYLLDLVK